MSLTVLTHTRRQPPDLAPTPARPVRALARDLDITQSLDPHRHPWGQLTFALSGVLRVTTPGSSWIVPPLRAIWVAPEVVHSVHVLEDARLRPLGILAARAPFEGDECRVLAVSPLLRELIVALGQTAAGPRETLLAELILDELPGAATRPMRVPMPQDKRMSALCLAMIDDPACQLTLGQWAQRVGASERTLTRLFERELGMSFGHWRQQVRLAHAAPLIARGMPLSQVAGELGYTSQSAFSAMFKKTFGCSPSAFFGGRGDGGADSDGDGGGNAAEGAR